ncbi:MAG: CopG family transcriptional regulator [Peptococcus niger]
MTTKKMGRPPSENPKNKKLTIRMTQTEMDIIEECAKCLKTSKTDVVMRGVHLVYDSIKKDS